MGLTSVATLLSTSLLLGLICAVAAETKSGSRWSEYLRERRVGISRRPPGYRASGRLQTLRGMAEGRMKLIFLPEFGGLAVPSNPASLAWLRRYFATTYGSWGPDWNRTEWAELPPVPCRRRLAPSHALRRARSLSKRYLVLALVGDTWSPQKWLTNMTTPEFDLAVVYIGRRPRTFRCPECSHIWRMRGLKWQIIQRVSALPIWDDLAVQYHYVMFADDDLKMNACDINTHFRVVHQYSLLLAQPSLCKGSVSWVAKFLTQRPGNLLRYTTFVEIMAPTFDMGFFTDVVRHTFFVGVIGYGFGSDHLWPALLRYPRRGVAVVDAICMVHPKRQSGSIYTIPTTFPKPETEADIINELFKYRALRARLKGTMQELSAVRLRAPVPPPVQPEELGGELAAVTRGRLQRAWLPQMRSVPGALSAALLSVLAAGSILQLRVAIKRRRKRKC